MNPDTSCTAAIRLRAIAILLLFTTLIMPSFPALATSAKKTGAPDSLQKWIPWVLYNQEDKTCTLRSDDITRRYCSWPSRLTIELTDSRAVFKQEWLIETESLVPLPGNSTLWPESVKDGNTNISVIDHHKIPSVRLKPGHHVLTGNLAWKNLPDSIRLPPSTGLVKISNKSTKISQPFLDKEGRLWLKSLTSQPQHELDQASVQVFRKIRDTIPLLENLHIILTVSGTPREIPLGMKMTRDFLPLQITSPLPVRIDGHDRLLIQARPGQWSIDLVLRSTSFVSPTKLSRGNIRGLWPENEVWVFEASPKLRQVHIENVRSIDPSRTGLPSGWLKLPAFLMGPKDEMHLIERKRGNSETMSDSLKISRTLWLDQTGKGLTSHDVISGTMTKGWRLNVVPGQILGKVDVDGISQLITKLAGSDKIGVEVRKGALSLTADSRIEQPVHAIFLSLPALGWDHTFQHLSANLNLPPGWKLLTSSGVDKVPTWLNSWTLLDIFLVLITSLATGKILGRYWGMLTLILLSLIYHQPGAPIYQWLPLLALIAIGNRITSEKRKTLVRIPLGIVLLLLVLQTVPFMVKEVRIGIFPQLERGPYFQLAATDNLAARDSAPSRFRKIGTLKTKSPMPAKRMYSLQRTVPLAEKLSSSRTNKEMQIDPRAMIQTGPGLPDWHWRTIPMSWNGPVTPHQKIHLILLSPWINCILAFLRVCLLVLLALGFLKRALLLFGYDKTSNLSSVRPFLFVFFILLSVFGTPTLSKAEIPTPEILQELQNRLLANPVCGTECASLDYCLLLNQGDTFKLGLTIHTQAETAVPLPGNNRTFSSILVDTVPAKGLRTDNNILYILLPAGIHHLTLEKDLKDLNTFSLSFPLVPHRVQAKLIGWTITGLHADGTMERQINLKKSTAVKEGNHNAPLPKTTENLSPAPFFQVIRTLHLGLKWSVDTRVVRKSRDNIITAEIPLLKKEMPTTESLFISDNKIQVNLGPKKQVFSWHSVLPQGKSLTLSAAKTTDWVEVWYLDISPIWHVTDTGLPAVSTTNTAGLRFPEYHPYPGESLTLAISRPVGVPGPTMTIDSSRLTVLPGIRETNCTADLDLHASRGMDHTIHLPSGISLRKVLINNKEYQLQPNEGKLTLPILPGKQHIQLHWQSKKGISTKTLSPRIDLGIPSVNSTIHMTLPYSRWILLTGGPKIGPAVLFWGEVIVLLLLSLILGRIRLTPLTSLQWFLLGIGLSQVNVLYSAFVVGWFLLMGLRKSKGQTLSSPKTFNLLQICIVLTSILACISLLYAVQKGLLGYPDMQIGGNGSFNHSLNWYQDRNLPLLPQAWVISLPLFVYRSLMLCWALWLALSLMRWLGWAWTSFTTGGIWRKTPTRSDSMKIDAIDDKGSRSMPQKQELENNDLPISDVEESGIRKESRFRRFLHKVKSPLKR